MERYGWGHGISVTTALCPSGLAVGDDEGDCVVHRLRSDLSSWRQETETATLLLRGGRIQPRVILCAATASHDEL